MNPLLVGLVQGLNQTKNNPDFQNAIPVNPDQAAQALGYESADKAREAGFNIPNETHYYHEGTGENLTATANGGQKPMRDLTAAGETPMQQPTLLHRMFNPESAQAADTVNRNWTMQGPQAQQAENIKRGLLLSQIQTIPDQFRPAPGGGNSWNTTIAENQGLGSLSNQASQRSILDIQNEVPGYMSEAAKREAQAEAATSINKAREEVASGQHNLPEDRPFLESLQLGSAIPLAANRIKNIDLYTGKETVDASAGLRQAEVQPLAAGGPFPSFIDPKTGRIMPNTGHELDPNWMSSLSTIRAMQQKEGSDAIPASSGGQWLPKITEPEGIDPSKDGLRGSTQRHSGTTSPPSDVVPLKAPLPITLGSSLGGENIDTTPTKHESSMSRDEALDQLGFRIDENGQLQDAAGSFKGQYARFKQGYSKLTDEQRLQKAMQIINNKYIK